jgi:hypothetical protein
MSYNRPGYYGGKGGKGRGKGQNSYRMDMMDEVANHQNTASYCKYVADIFTCDDPFL